MTPMTNKALGLRGATPGRRRRWPSWPRASSCSRARRRPRPAPAASGLVKAIKVLPDKAPDCSTLKTMVDSITRECKTNDAKMIAINNFMRIATYHRADPWTPAMRNFTNFGWALCGGLAGYQQALYAQVPGWAWRGVSVPGHNMSEAKYDGTWHWVDCFTKFYCWRQDPNAPNGRTIACHTDIKNDPGLVNDLLVLDPKEQIVYDKRNRKEIIGDRLNWTAPALLVCGDELKYCVYQRNTRLLPESTKPDPEWVNPSYTAEVNLTPGMAHGEHVGPTRPAGGTPGRSRTTSSSGTAAATGISATTRLPGRSWSLITSGPAVIPTAAWSSPPTSSARRCSRTSRRSRT